MYLDMYTLFLNVLSYGSVSFLLVLTLMFIRLFLVLFVLSLFCSTKQVIFQLTNT